MLPVLSWLFPSSQSPPGWASHPLNIWLTKSHDNTYVSWLKLGHNVRKKLHLPIQTCLNRVYWSSSHMEGIAKVSVSSTRSTETRPMTTPPLTRLLSTRAAAALQATSSRLSPAARNNQETTSLHLTERLEIQAHESNRGSFLFKSTRVPMVSFTARTALCTPIFFLQNVFAYILVHWYVFFKLISWFKVVWWLFAVMFKVPLTASDFFFNYYYVGEIVLERKRMTL